MGMMGRKKTLDRREIYIYIYIYPRAMSHEPRATSLHEPVLTLPYLIVPISLPSLFALLAHSSR
jgi:hypothetical protein